LAFIIDIESATIDISYFIIHGNEKHILVSLE
jgi:hypothetical protein